MKLTKETVQSLLIEFFAGKLNHDQACDPTPSVFEPLSINRLLNAAGFIGAYDTPNLHYLTSSGSSEPLFTREGILRSLRSQLLSTFDYSFAMKTYIGQNDFNRFLITFKQQLNQNMRYSKSHEKSNCKEVNTRIEAIITGLSRQFEKKQKNAFDALKPDEQRCLQMSAFCLLSKEATDAFFHDPLSEQKLANEVFSYLFVETEISKPVPKSASNKDKPKPPIMPSKPSLSSTPMEQTLSKIAAMEGAITFQDKAYAEKLEQAIGVLSRNREQLDPSKIETALQALEKKYEQYQEKDVDHPNKRFQNEIVQFTARCRQYFGLPANAAALKSQKQEVVKIKLH